MTFRRLYGTRSVYASRVTQRLTELIREGWFLPEYADLVRDDTKTVAFEIRR
jgi:hypothetical protein